ncbi:hypothetical protein ACCI51_06865 [Microbulbifer echini]|uniref:Uncharacterized protein n=1 Tax=Microbulbifer echini TaxID=1529067 RepID=A0ABV4NMM8_9GAMM
MLNLRFEYDNCIAVYPVFLYKRVKFEAWHRSPNVVWAVLADTAIGIGCVLCKAKLAQFTVELNSLLARYQYEESNPLFPDN